MNRPVATSARSLLVHLVTAEVNCKPNTILLSGLLDHFLSESYEVTRKAEEADLIFINTCAFDHEHEEISMRVVEAVFRKKQPGARVISLGCLNVIGREALTRRFPELTILDDPAELNRIVEATVPFQERHHLDASLFKHIEQHGMHEHLPNRIARVAGRVSLDLHRRFGYPRADAVLLQQLFEEMHHENKFYLQIGSGCAGNCAYCVIKQVKGEPRSRKIGDILKDIRENNKDMRTVNLVADDCGSYGRDTGDSLFELVRRIREEFPSLMIELCYVNPSWIDRHPDTYVEMFRNGAIASVNVSMQSGSDRVVAMMNRRYKVDRVVQTLERIRLASPKTLLWTHLMVGFPGETWADFRQTLKLSDRFHFFVVFPYSEREGTGAAALGPARPAPLQQAWKRMLYARLALRISTRLLGIPMIGSGGRAR